MSFELTRDLDLFRRFYEDEQTYPQHWQDAANNWSVGWDDFKAFCDKCERIYSDENSLVYIERINNNANLHFSLLRGSAVGIDTLAILRDELLPDYDMLFAWVGKHNRGLRKIVEQCGMVKTGLEMRKGQTHNKVIVWECFTVSK